MDKLAFKTAMYELFSYFRVKDYPSESLIANWHHHVEHIPFEAVDWIKARIEAERDSLPRNIPKAFAEGFQQWRQAHPEKSIGHQQGHCDECRGTGLLWWVVEDPYRCEQRGRCALCDNWKRHFSDPEAAGPPVTRAFLESSGLNIHMASRSHT